MDILNTGNKINNPNNVNTEHMREKTGKWKDNAIKSREEVQGIENNRNHENKKREPCKLLCLNTQRLISQNSRWNVDKIKEYVSENNIIVMNFTETWLNKDIQDEKIPNFSVFRGDRKGGKTK